MIIEEEQTEGENVEETKEQEAHPEEINKEHVLGKESGRVCITYGRDVLMNKQVVSLIRELGIDPLVMQDKENATKPLADFSNEHPDVNFVIAILSGDDWVYPKDGKPSDALLRADQGVIFHLGFWVGKLGREKVYALYYDQRSYRWPTEYFDVIYTSLDKEGLWKKELVKRLNDSGMKVANLENQ